MSYKFTVINETREHVSTEWSHKKQGDRYTEYHQGILVLRRNPQHGTIECEHNGGWAILISGLDKDDELSVAPDEDVVSLAGAKAIEELYDRVHGTCSMCEGQGGWHSDLGAWWECADCCGAGEV